MFDAALTSWIKKNFGSRFLAVSLILPLAVTLVSARSTPKAAEMKKERAVTTYGKLPLHFEANRGQTDSRIKFISRGRGYTLFLAETEAVLRLRKPVKAKTEPQLVGPSAGTKDEEGHGRAQTATVRMQLMGANPQPQVTGVEELPGKTNYFTGKNPEKWRRNVPTYAKVQYRDVYPGVDLVFYGSQGEVEYDFIVAPGAEASVIQLSFHGADTLEVDVQGDLVLHIAREQVRFKKPLLYQEVGGARQAVAGSYRLRDGHVSFHVEPYDVARALVIDPVLLYSTYLGGSRPESGSPWRNQGIAVDASGAVYVTGSTLSSDFPTVNPLQSNFDGLFEDVFVAKLDADGSTLLYSTYLGGGGSDYGADIAVDASGAAYVTGSTPSSDFPTVNPFQAALGGREDVFVAKLDADGSTLLYSTYLGGTGNDFGMEVAINTSGQAHVVGRTNSGNFPTANAFQGNFGGGAAHGDGFVAKLDAAGSTLLYSTYLGGNAPDFAGGIALDAVGNAYVTGGTCSTNFPTVNPFQAARGGSEHNDIEDAFVTKLDAEGSVLYSTYLGGGGEDAGWGIAVDMAGNAYMTGWTSSPDWPIVNPLQTTLGGDESFDFFVSKLDSTGSALLYSTYLGGNDAEFGKSIAVDTAGNVYVTASTSSLDFPTVNALQPFYGGGTFDAVVVKLGAAGSVLYSTYLGGNSWDNVPGLAVDTAGNAYVTGTTTSSNFPTVNPLQPTYGGLRDAFVAKIGEAKHLYFAHFGNGAGFTSDIVLSNPSATATASGQVNFFDDDGQPLQVGIAGAPPAAADFPAQVSSSAAFSIAPLGTATISTDGLGDVAVGSAVVSANRVLGGVVRFQIAGTGIAGVGASEPLSGFVVPVRRMAGLNTGIAVHNTENQSVTLNLTLRNTQGEEISNGTSTIENLPAAGHVAKFIHELFPAADTDNFEGTLVVEATGGKVAATALELGTEPGEFTTLPVTALQ